MQMKTSARVLPRARESNGAQRQGTVSNRVLGQVIVYDQHVLALTWWRRSTIAVPAYGAMY